MKIENDLYEKGGGVCYQATLITEGMDDEELLSAIVSEWPEYRKILDQQHATSGMSPEDVVKFWEINKEVLPTMFKIARILMLGQPSSAAAERVFSVLSTSFRPFQ